MLNEMEFALNWMVKFGGVFRGAIFLGQQPQDVWKSMDESDMTAISTVLISSFLKCGSGAIYVHLGVIGDQL